MAMSGETKKNQVVVVKVEGVSKIKDLSNSSRVDDDRDKSNTAELECSSMSSESNDSNGHTALIVKPPKECNTMRLILTSKTIFTSVMFVISSSFLFGYFYQEIWLFESTEKTNMPIPTLHPEKSVPMSKYSGEMFDDKSVRSSYNIHMESPREDHKVNDIFMDDLLFEPAGQHLLVDIKNVNGDFLNSERRLADAIINVVNESHLTLLSYHCHGLLDTGVSCVGVLLESHISLHTWPENGVILFDLYTCGPDSLLPLVPIIEKSFAIKEEKFEELPRIVWSHKLRGFRGGKSVLENGLSSLVLDRMLLDYKKEVVSVQTPKQRIDIYDVIDPRFGSVWDYEESEKNVSQSSSSYHSQHPEYFKPNRMLFLDGYLEKSLKGFEAYHEAFVHPAMLSHSRPQKIFMKGNFGGVLKEVLKHRNVLNVTILEPDPILVELTNEYFPKLNDCSFLIGSTKYCSDNSNVHLTQSNTFQENEIFDVAFLDVSKEILKNNLQNAFPTDFFNMMDEKGVLVLKLGKRPPQFRLEYLKTMLHQFHFVEALHYHETHAKLDSPIGFLLACRNAETCHEILHRKEFHWERLMHERHIPTVTGKHSFEYFDVASMKWFIASTNNVA